jgi:hypothetical protein
MDLKQLVEPFPPSDIEWRIGRAGNKDGKVWATCLAYITNRAIMDRLDEVCGPDNWRNEYKTLPIGANDSTVLCGISIKVGDEWVTKWDGSGAMESNAGLSGADAAKGTLSGAMKRAAVQWGIGRYLYDLPEGYATVEPSGRHYQPASKRKDKEVPAFKWNPPALPKWALPESHKVA